MEMKENEMKKNTILWQSEIKTINIFIPPGHYK